MIDFTKHLKSLNVVKRIKHALHFQPYIRVSTSIDVRANVPRKCGVYFIYRKSAVSPQSEKWELRYVGVHKTVRQRLYEHLFYPPDSGTKHKAY